VKIHPNKPAQSHIPATHGGKYGTKNLDPQVIDFSSNVNPLGCHPGVKRYLKKHLDMISEYPDPNSTNLRTNLAWFTGVPKKQIVVGNGATEIIYNFCKTFLNKKTRVLIPIPTFSEYEVSAKLCECKISFFKTMDLSKNLQKFAMKIPRKGCVFICNPNNPTGVLIQKKEMLKIISAAKKKSTIVFVDETFIELVPGHDESVIKHLKNFENLFILRSLTKSFGLAGIRIGYGVGSPQIIDPLQKIKIPWNVSNMAQLAASAAVCYHPFLDKTCKLIKKERNFIFSNLAKSKKFACYTSATNFILVKTKVKSKLLQKKLLKQKILIRDCSTFRGLNLNYIRVAVKTRRENIKLLKALEAI
jgi:threonine-phosphate decarboxylase